MSEQNANFTEVLEIKADLQSFVQSLQAMQNEYQTFLGRLNKMAAGTALSPGTNLPQTQKQTQAERELQRVRETSNRALARYLSLSDEQQRKIAGQTTALNTFWSKL